MVSRWEHTNGKFFPHINDIVLACSILLFWCKKIESLSFISEATSELNTMAEHVVLPCIYLLPSTLVYAVNVINTDPVRCFINLRNLVTSARIFFDSLNMTINKRPTWVVYVTYLCWISSSRSLVFHSTVMSSHSCSLASVSASNTCANVEWYFPISFSPLLESDFCFLEIRSMCRCPHAALVVHVLDDVRWPHVSDLPFAGLDSLACPLA